MSIQSLGEQVLIPYLSYTGPLKKAFTISQGQGIVKPYLAASVFIGGDVEDDVDVFEGKQAGNGISRSLCNIFTQSPLIASAGDFTLELEVEEEEVEVFDLLSLFLVFEEEDDDDDDGNGSSPQSYKSH